MLIKITNATKIYEKEATFPNINQELVIWHKALGSQLNVHETLIVAPYCVYSSRVLSITDF